MADSIGTNLTGTGGAGIKSFTLAGLASGLDTNSIITRLIQIESIPVARAQQDQARLSATLTLYQDMNSRVLAVKTAADALRDKSLFSARQAVSSDTAVATATASTTATPGSHEVLVMQMGKPSTRSSAAAITYLDRTKPLDQAGYRTPIQFVTRTVGTRTGEGGAFKVNDTTVDFWKDDTIDDVMARINATVPDVSASYDAATDKVIMRKGDGSTITVSDEVGNFIKANGFNNNQVGTGEIQSLARVGKTVRADMKVKDAFSAPVSDGVMSINGAAIAVRAEDTLQAMIDKINRSAAGVTATFSSTNNSLTLTAKALGSSQISLGSDSSGLMAALKLDTATTSLGLNTIVQVDGALFERSATKLTDVIDGVTLDLKKVSAEPIRVSVATDTGKLKSAIQGYVDAYNKLADFYESNSKGPEFDGTKLVAAGGALLGDTALNTVMFAMKRSFSQEVAGLPVGMNDLSDIGVTLGSPLAATGGNKLFLDADKLSEALANDAGAVERLFTQKDTGLADAMQRLFKTLVGTPGATVDATITLKNLQINDIEDRIKTMQERIEKKRLDLLKVFTNMESAMSTIQNQGNSLLTTLQQQLATATTTKR